MIKPYLNCELETICANAVHDFAIDPALVTMQVRVCVIACFQPLLLNKHMKMGRIQ